MLFVSMKLNSHSNNTVCFELWSLLAFLLPVLSLKKKKISTSWSVCEYLKFMVTRNHDAVNVAGNTVILPMDLHVLSHSISVCHSKGDSSFRSLAAFLSHQEFQSHLLLSQILCTSSPNVAVWHK